MTTHLFLPDSISINCQNFTQCPKFYLPRWRSRPKFWSDQTFQTEVISDQTSHTEINPDQIFQTQVTSDQTFQTQGVSDQAFHTEGVLIRPSSDHGPDSNSYHSPDLNQTMIRLKCARNIYGQTQLRIYDQTEARSK